MKCFAWFCPESLKHIIREKLVSSKQLADEPISEYISRFQKLTQTLDLSEKQKIAQFVSNVQGHIKEYLMLNVQDTLADTYQRARVKYEAQKLNAGSIESRMERLITLQEQQLEKNRAQRHPRGPQYFLCQNGDPGGTEE